MYLWNTFNVKSVTDGRTGPRPWSSPRHVRSCVLKKCQVLELILSLWTARVSSWTCRNARMILRCSGARQLTCSAVKGLTKSVSSITNTGVNVDRTNIHSWILNTHTYAVIRTDNYILFCILETFFHIIKLRREPGLFAFCFLNKFITTRHWLSYVIYRMTRVVISFYSNTTNSKR